MNRNTMWYMVYLQAKASAQRSGQPVLSYGQWLAAGKRRSYVRQTPNAIIIRNVRGK